MLSSFLDQTATHERATSADDGSLGTDRTWSTQNAAVPVAVWPAGSAEARSFYRRDLIGSHVVAAASDLGAKAKDRLLINSVYYLVNGFEKYSNAGVSAEVVYLMDCSKRTV